MDIVGPYNLDVMECERAEEILKLI